MLPDIQPGSSPPDNTAGLLALVLGIASIPLLFCYILGLPAGVAAIVLGIVGKRKADRGVANNPGQALLGIIAGAVGVLATIVIIALPDS
jgi:Domain of unknown function (DUF4190)